MDYEVFDLIQSETDDFSVSSNENKHRISLEDYKKRDKNYFKIYRVIQVQRTVLSKDNRTPITFTRTKRVPIEFYTTSYTPGSIIRNAITGLPNSRMYVGKKDEDLFFKVALATGELGQCYNSNHLYFDSPEDYENHFHCVVSKASKEAWVYKFNYEQQKRIKKNESAKTDIVIR